VKFSVLAYPNVGPVNAMSNAEAKNIMSIPFTLEFVIFLSRV